MSKDPVDPIAAMQPSIDQLQAAYTNIWAPMIRSFEKALHDLDVSPEIINQVVPVMFQNLLVSTSPNQREG